MRRYDAEWYLLLAFLAGLAGVAPVGANELRLPVGPSNGGHSSDRSEMRDRLMDKIYSMNAAEQGIFSEDVTEIVAPYFPAGQPIEATEAVLARQGLGSLRKFKGEEDPSSGTMYVAGVGLMNGLGSTVNVVIDFDFAGDARSTMTVRTVRAFIRAKSM